MFESFGVSPLMDLMLQYMLMGAMLGYFIHWSKTPEGEYWIQTRLLKKNALILLTLIPGRSFTTEVIVPKTEQYQKKPGQMQKLMAALHFSEKAEPSDHTVLLGWFRADAPIYRKMGSGVKYLFNRLGEAPAFDPEKVETGYYAPDKTAEKIYAEANAVLERNKDLGAQYQNLLEERKKLLEENKEEEAKQKQLAANQLALQAKQNEGEYLALMERYDASRVWWRTTVLPTHLVTVLLNNALSLVKAKEYQGFLGKLEAMLKDVRWQLLAILVLSGLAALSGVLTVLHSGGFGIPGLGGK